jgi:hypothetical protein
MNHEEGRRISREAAKTRRKYAKRMEWRFAPKKEDRRDLSDEARSAKGEAPSTP